MVMDIGFGTTSVAQHAGRSDASCCSLGQVCDCCDVVRICLITSAIFGATPMMTDTLTRTTVGDESWYSYCLRSQLLVCFRPERLVVFDLVGWFVGGLKLCASSFARERDAPSSGGQGGACVTWCVACAAPFLKDEVADWK